MHLGDFTVNVAFAARTAPLLGVSGPVSLRACQGLYEQSHLGSEHHLLDQGDCLGSGCIPCLVQDCPPWQSCAQLPGLGTEGLQRAWAL